MRNIDNELASWVIGRIEKEYKDDVALLIGHKGACKIPTDEQTMAFDFFVPSSKRGFNMAETFVIEDMGYDLFPMSWERLEGIADLNETITFALAEGVVLYAGTEEDKQRFLNIQQKLKDNLLDKKFTYRKSLEMINVAMDIFKTMIFDDDMSHVRKSAGGIMKYLSMAVATFNGTFLGDSYGIMELKKESSAINDKPSGFDDIYSKLVKENNIERIKKLTQDLIETTRKFFMKKRVLNDAQNERNYNYEDLADWYYEARYTFRRIEYYCKAKDYMSVYNLGCYLQIEFDAIQDEFGLKRMDLLGFYKYDDLKAFKDKAKELEDYIVNVLKDNDVKLKIYGSLEEFLEGRD